MKLFKTRQGYDFWTGEVDGQTVYNITPCGAPAPTGAYFDPKLICRIKGVPINSFERITGVEILEQVEIELRKKDLRLTDTNFVNQLRKMSFK